MKNMLNVWKSTTRFQNQLKRMKTWPLTFLTDRILNQRTQKTNISKEICIKPFCKSGSWTKFKNISAFKNKAQLIHVHCIKTV